MEALGASLYVNDLDEPHEPQPSKADMRAEIERRVAEYQGPVTRLPTVLHLKCTNCRHRGTVRVQPGERKRFKCSRCGAVSL